MERLRDAQESGVVLVLGTTDWQRHMIYKELQRIDPTLSPVSSEEAGPSTVVEVPSCSMRMQCWTSCWQMSTIAFIAWSKTC